MKQFLKDSWFKVSLLVIITIVIVGVGYLISKNNNEKELFTNKKSCATYTQKRQKEAEEKARLLGHSISVEGFYSPTANTCMTSSIEIAPTYIQATLIDELTGKTEAHAFDAIGEELKRLSIEGMRYQVEQDNLYHERLKYFQGTK
jgi:hypothetical protein